ncbi:MAG: hypothetical protein RSB70_02675 [Clostridium sp.]
MKKEKKTSRDKISNPYMKVLTTPNMPNPASDPIVSNNIVNSELDYTYNSNRDDYTNASKETKKD